MSDWYFRVRWYGGWLLLFGGLIGIIVLSPDRFVLPAFWTWAAGMIAYAAWLAWLQFGR